MDCSHVLSHFAQPLGEESAGSMADSGMNVDELLQDLC